MGNSANPRSDPRSPYFCRVGSTTCTYARKNLCTLRRRVNRTLSSVNSYYVAEADEWRALAAIRIHAGVDDDAALAS